jgi:hypothetical protein
MSTSIYGKWTQSFQSNKRFRARACFCLEARPALRTTPERVTLLRPIAERCVVWASGGADGDPVRSQSTFLFRSGRVTMMATEPDTKATVAAFSDLANGTAYRFSEWPNSNVPRFGAGVYTIWRHDGGFIYVGMSGRGMTADTVRRKKPQGIYTRSDTEIGSMAHRFLTQENDPGRSDCRDASPEVAQRRKGL